MHALTPNSHVATKIGFSDFREFLFLVGLARAGFAAAAADPATVDWINVRRFNVMIRCHVLSVKEIESRQKLALSRNGEAIGPPGF